jgi:hypothetical protein
MIVDATVPAVPARTAHRSAGITRAATRPLWAYSPLSVLPNRRYCVPIMFSTPDSVMVRLSATPAQKATAT